MRRCEWLLAVLSSAWLVSFASGAQPGPLWQSTSYKGQEIGKLTGDVYYARTDDYVSAFMVTPDGIVLVEPVGTEHATWLKGELARRFGVPVKYVIYSHSHGDHASGAAVFADTARIIGHEALLGLLAMPAATTQLPQNLRAQDGNGNGRIERGEAQAQIAAGFDFYDADGDGALSGAEATRGPLKHVAPPDLTYTAQVNITLGGKRVEVIPIPTDHAPDNTVVRFVDGSNVVFASDWITNGRVPFGRERHDADRAREDPPSRGARLRALRLQPRPSRHEGRRRRELALPRSRCRGCPRRDRRRQDARADARHRPHERLRRVGVLRAATAAERRGRVSLADREPLKSGPSGAAIDTAGWRPIPSSNRP